MGGWRRPAVRWPKSARALPDASAGAADGFECYQGAPHAGKTAPEGPALACLPRATMPPITAEAAVPITKATENHTMMPPASSCTGERSEEHTSELQSRGH